MRVEVLERWRLNRGGDRWHVTATRVAARRPIRLKSRSRAHLQPLMGRAFIPDGPFIPPFIRQKNTESGVRA